MNEQKKQELRDELNAIKEKYGLRAIGFCATDSESADLIGFFGVGVPYLNAEYFEAVFNTARLYQAARERVLKPII